jgi:CHAT domain-containing protein/Tfp pilus assembly protein PilF
MAAHSFLTCLTLLVLAGEVPAGAADKALDFRDDFATDSRKEYQVEGDVTWVKGRVTLASSGVLVRPLRAGARVDVRAVLRWAPGQPEGAFMVLLRDEQRTVAALALVTKDGTTRLVNGATKPPHVLTLTAPDRKGPAAEGPWAVRLALDQGLARVKVWPHGSREPASWLSIRYTGVTGWQPIALDVMAGRGPGGLEALAVRGDAPLVLSEEQQRFRQEARKAGAAAEGLLRQNRYAEALAKVQESLAALRKALPADHPSVASALTNSGLLLQNLGQLEEARAALGQSVTMHRKVLPADHPDLSVSLDLLASVSQGLRRWDEAKACYEEALAIRRACLPPDDPKIAHALNNLGSLKRSLGQPREALDCYKQALALLRKAVPPNHPSLAHTLTNLGHVLHDLGQPEAARPRYEAALAIFRKADPPHPREVVKALVGLATVVNELGHTDEALALLQEAVALQDKFLQPGHPDQAATRQKQALLLCNLGRLDRALAYQREALALFEKALPAGDPRLAPFLHNHGILLQRQGKPDEARRYYEQSLGLLRAAGPAQHVDLAQALSDVGALFAGVGQPEKARSCFVEALALRRRLLPPQHPAIARSLSDLGAALCSAGQRDQARLLLEEALALERKALPARHANLALTLTNLGAVHYHTGRLPQARDCFREALAIRRAPKSPDRGEVGKALQNLALVCQEEGRVDEALRSCEEARGLLTQALPAGHPTLCANLCLHGQLLHEAGQPDAAWASLREAALLQARHVARTAAGSAQADHAGLLRDTRVYLGVLLSAAFQAPAPSARQRQEALAAVLAYRAVSSAAVALRLEAVAGGGDPRAARLLAQLQEVRRRLADLLLQGTGGRTPNHYRAQCDKLAGEAETLERELAAAVKPYAKLHRAAATEPAQLAAQLPDGTVLVVFVRYLPYTFQGGNWRSRWGEPRYAALLLRRGGPDGAPAEVDLVSLGAAAPLDQAVQAWRRHVQTGTVDGPAERALREALWGPLARVLPKATTRLVLALDGALAGVPFEALRLSEGEYLIERYAVHYVTSGRDLFPRPRPAQEPPVAVVLADPDYDTLGGAAGGAGLPGPRPAPGLPPFRRLPGFAREADAVTRLLQDQAGWRAQPLRQLEATEEALAQAKRMRLLYCITHGFFLEDQERPKQAAALLRKLEVSGSLSEAPRLPDPRLRSGLALAGANKAQERAAKGLSDGLLTALEVENLDLWGTELVVLSACETGRGEVQVGEGVLGLRRAFQIAGAQTVLASLWMVPDQETERLMTECLKRWLDGAPPAEALRQAQLQMIRQLRQGAGAKRQAPPLYWAGFICHGQP